MSFLFTHSVIVHKLKKQTKKPRTLTDLFTKSDKSTILLHTYWKSPQVVRNV